MSETTYPVRTGYQKSPVEQRQIARAVSVNNVFSNLTLEDKTLLANNEEVLHSLFSLAEEIEKWLVRQ